MMRRLAAPVTLALLWGVTYFQGLGAFEMLVWDEAEYASLGRSLARGEGYRISDQPHVLRPPVLPASVAAALIVAGEEWDLAAKRVMPLFALLALGIVYAATATECGGAAALVAVWALACCVEFWCRTVMLLSEIPFMAFYAGSIVAFGLGFRRNSRWLYAAWGLWGLSLLTRYTALLAGPTLVLIVIFEWTSNRRGLLDLLRSRTFWLAPLTGAVCVAPWFARQWVVFGDALIGVKQAAGQVPAYNVWSAPWFYYFVDFPDAISWWFAGAGLAGLLIGALQRRSIPVCCAAAVAVLLGWHSQYDYKSVRLALPTLPFLAIGVGYAVAALRSWLPRTAGGLAVSALAVLLTVQGFLGASSRLRSQQALGEPSFLDAMEYLGNVSDRGDVVLGTNTPQIHWYSDRNTNPIPSERTQFAPSLAAADWVVVTNFERGQPTYVAEIFSAIDTTGASRTDLRMFDDGAYRTLVVKASWLFDRLD